MKICPACSQQMRIRTSRMISTTKEARRECLSCGYKDVATIRPAEVIGIRVVGTTNKVPPIRTSPVKSTTTSTEENPC